MEQTSGAKRRNLIRNRLRVKEVRRKLKELLAEYLKLRDMGLSIEEENIKYNELLDKYEKLLSS